MESRNPIARAQEYLRETDGWWPGLRYYIYALIDPRDMRVRYIGSTSNPIGRLSWHLRAPLNADMKAWFRDLKANDLKPRLMTLAEIDGPHPAFVLESIYIYEYQQRNEDLLNKQNPLAGQVKLWWEEWAGKWRSSMRRKAYLEVKPTLSKRRGANAGKTFPLEGVVIEAHGKRQNKTAWAKELGISTWALTQRLKKYPPEIALSARDKNLQPNRS